MNDGDRPYAGQLPVTGPPPADLDRCRRAQAAAIIAAVRDHAVAGDDGTATWVAPVLGPTGWAVQPLPADLYGGAGGVAVVLAAYLREARHGRADPVPGAGDLLAAVLRTCRKSDARHAAELAAARDAGITPRPAPAGGYLGLGSRIGSWLLLARLGAVGRDEALERAAALAAQLPEAVAADQTHDLMAGAAGAVVPLLRLAEHTGEARWTALATGIGERLGEFGTAGEHGLAWSSRMSPVPVAGLAHGSAGIGWALARLAAATGAPGAGAHAAAAFAFVASLYDPARDNWRDPRGLKGVDTTQPTWCNGTVGIGIAAADLWARDAGTPEREKHWRELVGLAAGVAWRQGAYGSGHTLCHGDASAWELLVRAEERGVAPDGVDREVLTARLLGSIAEYGPTTGAARDAFEPGLLPGVGGVAYQLLRMHPDCDLPSVLLPDPG